MSLRTSSSVPPSPWLVEHHSGRAGDLHSLDLAGRRAIHVMVPSVPAIVLGSTQDVSVIDSEKAGSAGIDVCQRRSGGGVVFVHPSYSTWVDVFIPRDDPLWIDDVSLSSNWLGRAWVDVLATGGLVGAHVYDGPMHRGDIGAVVCFASSAPGEVFVDDMKVVGISQRRGRDGARFQCIVYRNWSPEMWSEILVGTASAKSIEDLKVACVQDTTDVLLMKLHRAFAGL